MWQNFKMKFRNFMMNRNGVDQLASAEIVCALAISIVGWLLSGFVSNVTALIAAGLNFIGMVLYFHCLFRIFSTNLSKRREENRKYIAWSTQRKTEHEQSKKRFNNRKEYKYFKCPNCKVRMRLKRGTGIVTITCRQCQTSFTQKA